MSSCEFEIREVDFETMRDFWMRDLWKDRRDPVRAMSSMLFQGGYDMRIYQDFRAKFFGLFVGDKLMGSLSCHRSSGLHMRCRGLYLAPEYRGQGWSAALFSAVEEEARRLHCEMIWSYPRKSALKAYEAYGFRVERDSPESVDHCYVAKAISRK